MGKLTGRVNRLHRRALRFVPVTAYRTVAESYRLRLEELEKRPNLDQRVAGVRRLLNQVPEPGDPQFRERIMQTRIGDEEAWLAHCLSFWESKARMDVLGDWQPADFAEKILEIARRAKADLERRKEATAAEWHNRELEGR